MTADPDDARGPAHSPRKRPRSARIRFGCGAAARLCSVDGLAAPARGLAESASSDEGSNGNRHRALLCRDDHAASHVPRIAVHAASLSQHVSAR